MPKPDDAGVRSREDVLLDFVAENFFFGKLPDGFDNDSSFIELGVLDSTGVLELVTFVEREFSFKVADDELSPDNLDSINSVLAYLDRKVGGPA